MVVIQLPFFVKSLDLYHLSQLSHFYRHSSWFNWRWVKKNLWWNM